MPADPKLYDSERLAELYARFRPAVHQPVCARIRQQLVGPRKFRNALDAGCGGGASTAALVPHADQVTGLDPYIAMLKRAAMSVGSASFVQGRLEALPFESAAFQLVATAGAINYTDPVVALPELARVLQPGGWLAAYDFSAGRKLSVDSPLPTLYAQFRNAFPPPAGYPLDLPSLPYADAGLVLVSYENFTVSTPMSLHRYVDYLLSETGVEAAVAAGATDATVRHGCESIFRPAFGDDTREVLFDVQLAIAQRPPRPAS